MSISFYMRVFQLNLTSVILILEYCHLAFLIGLVQVLAKPQTKAASPTSKVFVFPWKHYTTACWPKGPLFSLGTRNQIY